MNLSANTKQTLVQFPVGLGSASTGAKSSVIDMSGFNGCMFTGTLGTFNSTGQVTMFIQSSTASGGTYVAIGGATVSSSLNEDDKILIVDVYKPQDRFIRAVSAIASTAGEFGGIVATQYEPNDVPTTHASSTLAATPVLSVSITT